MWLCLQGPFSPLQLPRARCRAQGCWSGCPLFSSLATPVHLSPCPRFKSMHQLGVGVEGDISLLGPASPLFVCLFFICLKETGSIAI